MGTSPIEKLMQPTELKPINQLLVDRATKVLKKGKAAINPYSTGSDYFSTPTSETRKVPRLKVSKGVSGG